MYTAIKFHALKLIDSLKCVMILQTCIAQCYG